MQLIDKIKICFIVPKAYPLFNPGVKELFGGAEVDLYFLATELAKDKDFAVSFITADYGQKQAETIEGVRVIKSVDFKKNPFNGAVRIWRAMQIAEAEIYFQEVVSWGTFLTALFCKLHKRAFIYRTANTKECDGTYAGQCPITGKAFRWSLRSATQVVVQNLTDQKAIKQTMNVDSIVIPNAHHLPVLPEDKKNIILWVGRSTPLKRPQLFIDLAAKMPNDRFVMICQHSTGDQDYKALAARAGKIKNLQFIDRVPFDKIDSYFQRAKMLVNTSDSEGFPNTYVEACKYAAPILSLCINPDNFLAAYKCGMCANDNWDEFVQQFKILLNPEKARQYGKNARKYAEQRHDIKNIIKVYKELFLKLKENNKQ